ncbi:MAG TPA: hypothetical protein VLA99_08320 [Nitrospiraceae bacterium]|nr:hypothetical protein [Nitrospiraceae bacterium]
MNHRFLLCCGSALLTLAFGIGLIVSAASAQALPAAEDPASIQEPAPDALPDQPEEATDQASSETSAMTAVAEDVDPWIQVSGTVWRMKPGFVFLRTPVGLLTLTCQTCLRDLRGAHHVTLWIHGSHGAVDITAKGQDKPVRRYLWGPPVFPSPDKKELQLWTPEGERAFATGALAAKLAAQPAGKPVTVEVNAAGAVVGLHNLQYDLQISQVPNQANRTEMKISGSVAKLKAGYTFLRTPVGMLPISSKTGLKQAKVGQDLTLWIHDTNMAVELRPNGEEQPTVRLLTGKLAYATPEKRELTLWTPEGEQQFPADQAKGTLAGLKEGSPVIVELNGKGSVVEIRKGH